LSDLDGKLGELDRRRAPPKSVLASMTPEQTMPMQISLVRGDSEHESVAISASGRPNSSLAMISVV
jgi:hypothetical protein